MIANETNETHENTYKRDLINTVAEKFYTDEDLKVFLDSTYLQDRLSPRSYKSLVKFITEEIVNLTFDTIVEDVSDEKDVKIHRFGTFSANWNKSKKGINPKTKEPVIHDAYLAVKFRASNIFKDSVRKKD